MLVLQKDIPTLKFSEPMNEALFGENKDLLIDAFKSKISGWDHPGLSTKLKDICKRHTKKDIHRGEGHVKKKVKFGVWSHKSVNLQSYAKLEEARKDIHSSTSSRGTASRLWDSKFLLLY